MAENNKLVITREQIRQVTEEACKACKMEDGFFEQLWDAFLKNDDVYKISFKTSILSASIFIFSRMLSDISKKGYIIDKKRITKKFRYPF